MAKIEVKGDKAKVQLYDGITGSSSEIELTREQIVNNAINQIPDMTKLNKRDFDTTNGVLDLSLEILDKMNEENNGD